MDEIRLGGKIQCGGDLDESVATLLEPLLVSC